MSESSEDKTKRQYLNVLMNHEWTYRHSVFYQDTTESVNLLDDMMAFKQLLRRRVPDQPFLIRIQLLNRNKKPQAYLTMFTTKKVVGLQEIVDKTFSAPMNTLGSKCSPERIKDMASKIDREQPHNLNWFFDKPQIRRWTILNKEKMFSGEMRQAKHVLKDVE